MKYLVLIPCLVLTACASSGKSSHDGLDATSKGIEAIAAEEGKVSLDDERIVCTRERHLGSNIAKRVCMTKAERKKAQEMAKARLENNYQQGDRDPKLFPSNTPNGPND